MTADERDQQVRALLLEGLAVKEVVRRTGATYYSVRKAALQLGCLGTRSHPNAPTHPWSKDQQDQQAAMREQQKAENKQKLWKHRPKKELQ